LRDEYCPDPGVKLERGRSRIPAAGCNQVETVLVACNEAESGGRREDPPVENVMTVWPQCSQQGGRRGRRRAGERVFQVLPGISVVPAYCEIVRPVEVIRPSGVGEFVGGRDAGRPEPPAPLPLEVSDGHYQVVPSHPALTVVSGRAGEQREPEDVVPEPAIVPRLPECANPLGGNAKNQHTTALLFV